ncbi:DnaJ domain-containing protein [Arthrobacter sp.]|uniref:J domain-containing protein n=1 Tax=Arthrobacter sp. TaxID=1667 RepID=UPI003392F21C
MNRDPRGYYAALHVAPDATAAEIQRAFRALMRLRHPDVDASSTAGQSPGKDEGDDARRILESFAVLRDPRSRAEYDPAADSGGSGRKAARGREIPVRHHRPESPVLRVTPVRWERGPL